MKKLVFSAVVMGVVIGILHVVFFLVLTKFVEDWFASFLYGAMVVIVGIMLAILKLPPTFFLFRGKKRILSLAISIASMFAVVWPWLFSIVEHTKEYTIIWMPLGSMVAIVFYQTWYVFQRRKARLATELKQNT